MALVEWPLPDLTVLPRIEIHFERGALDDERYMEICFFGMEQRQEEIAHALLQWAYKT